MYFEIEKYNWDFESESRIVQRGVTLHVQLIINTFGILTFPLHSLFKM